jgi:formylglycine-generating enzyme required for sulfatase activity
VILKLTKMKKVMISLFALLLLLAAQAQTQKEALAVLVVGVNNWMFGDVLAHMVGEELKRSNSNLVQVTREKFVQNKLKALRRATGDVDICELRKWASDQQLSQVCLVEAKKNGDVHFSFSSAQQSYSAQVIDVAGNTMSSVADFTLNRDRSGKMTSAELTKVAWEVVGRLQSSTYKPIFYTKCYSFGQSDMVEMVFVEGGTYLMGDSSSVTLSDFWIGKYEVTQGEWTSLMGTSIPEVVSSNSDIRASHPVYCVKYDDIPKFLDSLNVRTGRKGSVHEYRLPTEAEWEYAARGGASTHGYKYSGSNTLDDVAWYENNSGGGPQAVGTKVGNELGIYDMSGNVYEWCSGNWGTNFPSGHDPTGHGEYPPHPEEVARSGSWNSSADYNDVTHRIFVISILRSNEIGFRVVLP